jgi:uncharacterized protein
MNPIFLLEKYFPDPFPFGIVLQHSRLVTRKAIEIAENLSRKDIDMKFLEEAAMVHDIGICRTQSPNIGCHGGEPYIRHGIIGREILEKEGYPHHALVCERHIGVGITAIDVTNQGLPLPERDMVPLKLEEKIISFADLFYSKNPGTLAFPKTLDTIRANLSQFGEIKVRIFESWLDDIKYGS